MRVVGYIWAFPVTAVGLLLALCAALSGGSVRVRQGVVEVTGGLVAWLLCGNRLWQGGAAMALGHVIIARDRASLQRSRRHELFHTHQFERWGPLLIPAYGLVSLWLRCRGYDPYLDHPMEPPPE
jgi:hypothetical protein